MKFELSLNGLPVSTEGDADTSLLWLLRETLGLTGTKRGCGIGECGSCSVLLDGRLVNSCQVLAGQADGRGVVTIEGVLDPDGSLTDLQQAFVDHGAVQCGFCTPGLVMAGVAALESNSVPTRDEIRHAIAGNLCRCTGYQQVVDAIEATARQRQGRAKTAYAEGKEHAGKFAVVGNPATRLDAPQMVAGATRYVGDMREPGMLFTRVLRSTVPHGAITKLDVEPALAVPGVVAVVASEDFVDHGRYGHPFADNHILAWEKVRYVGDAIAAVAAEDERAAEAGLRAIVCEIDELPGVFSIEEALAPDAPLIGPDSNLCVTQIVRNGDPQAVLDECDIVFEESFGTSHQEHAYLETEGALAVPQPDGGVLVYANSQSPFITRDVVALVLGLAAERVRMVQPPVGGAFGGKDDVVSECAAQAAVLALKTGRPVRLILDREESFTASCKRDPMTTRVRVGMGDDGKLRAAQIEAHFDSGAYASTAPYATWRAAVHMAGPYRYEAVDIDAHLVYTNNSYSGAFRGFGNAQAVACIEQAIDEIADNLETDPIEFRLRNCLRSGDYAQAGQFIEDADGLAESLELVRDESDWKRKRAEFPEMNIGSRVTRGIGVACYFHGCSLGAEGDDHARVRLRVEADGNMTLATGLTDYGTGSRTVYTMIAAEMLGLDPARISMERPDTAEGVESGPTVASRATILGGNATRVTATRMNRLFIRAAADALGCSEDQVSRQGEDYMGPAGTMIGFDQVIAHARKVGFELEAEGYWEMPPIKWDFDAGVGEPYHMYSFGAQVVEVSVDTLSGKVDVVGVWAAHDGGQVIFPQGAFGQMYGGIAQGLGYGLMERLDWDRGRIRNVNFDEYLIPTAMDVPEIKATFLNTTSATGPYGAKNLAEPTLLPVAPAIANAVNHASGRRIRHLPATLERVLLGRELTRQMSGSAR